MISKEKLQPCILPWINFSTNPFGRARPCGDSLCKSDKKIKDSSIAAEFNGEVFKNVRKDFQEGKWPQNCQRCQYVEETKLGQSKKALERNFYERFSHLIQETQPDGSLKYFPKHIDIRLGNICNLKCIHCGTGASSKWHEDRQLVGRYSNIEDTKLDNSWIHQDSPLWKTIFEHLPEIEKFNFLGGEPFASPPHNLFIEKIAATEYAQNIVLHYVTNGTLLSDTMLSTLKKFKQVTINVSFDASEQVLEFFRFPIKSALLNKKLELLRQYQFEHFDLGLQWTSSNVSLFYLNQTLDFYEKNFSYLNFKFCSYVDDPIHMSPQNLPLSIKRIIQKRLEPYIGRYVDIELYLKQMWEADLWPEHGATLVSYLSDLSKIRNIDWRLSLSEFAKCIDVAHVAKNE